MKFVIASDVHGSAKYCKLLIDAFKRENADKLLLLGDILYHGPRNPLPDGYAPKEVAEMLSEIKEKIICVSGNCDAEIDAMILPFPLSDYAAVFADGINFYMSHGHRDVPPMSGGDVYLTGHTHVPLKEAGQYIHLNPGSVALPKENSKRGYILYDNRRFIFKTLESEPYDSLEVTSGISQSSPRTPTVRRKVVRRRRLI